MHRFARPDVRFARSLLTLGMMLFAVSSPAVDRLPTDSTGLPYEVELLRRGGVWGNGPGKTSCVMADIDGDGLKELIEATGGRLIGMEAEDGQIKNRWQINLEPGWVFDQRPLLGVAADLDTDGIDEIFTSIMNPQTGEWRFGALSPTRQDILFTAPLPNGPDRRADGHWDGRYYPQFLLPNADGHGRPGILFVREVQYDAYPRGLVAVDPFTGQIIWEWLCGPNPFPPSVREVDMGDRGQGIAFFGTAPNNLGGELVGGTSDDRGCVFLVSAAGQLVWRKEAGPGFSGGGLEVADIVRDGSQELITYSRSMATNVPSELAIWDWLGDKPLARVRNQACFEGLAVLDGPRKGTSWLVTGSDQGLVTRYLYADGKLIQDARVLSNQKICQVTGLVDILPDPGPEILLNVDERNDFLLLDRDLKTLAMHHDGRFRGTRDNPMIWPLKSNRKALVVGCDLGFWILDFHRRPLAWGPLLIRTALVVCGVLLLWGVFVLGRRLGRSQQAAAAIQRPADREALYRLWLELDDVKHERLFEPSKGFRRLVWLMDAFTSDLGTVEGVADRIIELMANFRSSDLPRLRGILVQAEAEQVATDAVDRTTMALGAAVGKLDALAAGNLTVARVRAVQQDLSSDLQKMEDGFLELWRTLGDFYTTDPARLIQGLLLIQEVELKRADITLQTPTIASDPVFLCRIDSSDLRYVLGNLLDNAVRALASPVEKRITLGLERKDLEVQITVTDSGAGIPVEHRERIFSGRFSLRGGGQGLFRSREILRRWRGEIRLVNTGDESGTTFTVTLPAAVKDIAATASRSWA